MMTNIYLGLGGNITNELGTPKEHILMAYDCIKNSTFFDQAKLSALYQSTPFGVTDQPDFINAVLFAKTTLSPLELLDFCQDLEQAAGRVRLRHWGERSLDVDVLLYGNQNIHHERLIVPHLGLFERNFVLLPLLTLTPDLIVDGQKLSELPAAQDNAGLTLLEF